MIDPKTIPPDVVEAAARAIVESLRTARLTMESEDGYEPEARAAILAALEAWPGMRIMVDIDTGNDAAFKLPLPTENSND